MRTYLAVTKALSDSNRVRMLCGLRGGELCVCQLIELLGLAPSTVSKHLSVMNQAGLVESRKVGRWVYYRLPRTEVSNAAARFMSETFEVLKDSVMIVEDAKRLEEIRKADLEALCRKTLGKS